jgi:hypothetical protein
VLPTAGVPLSLGASVLVGFLGESSTRLALMPAVVLAFAHHNRFRFLKARFVVVVLRHVNGGARFCD